MLHGKLLDVGCGKKPYAGLFSNVKMYVGLDVPSSMHGLSQVDVVSTCLTLPFRDACFGNVLCTEVLEHTPEPLAALQEMWRVTKPGGLLLLTVPLSEQLHEEPYDFYRFTKFGLDYLLRKSQWQTLRIYERGGAWLELGHRLSSFIYSAIGARQDPSGAFEPRFLLGPLVVFFCAVVQFLAVVMDKMWKSSLSTIGYGVVAQKPEEDSE